LDIPETSVVDATLFILGGFSLLTWSVILFKAGEIVFNRLRNRAFLENFRHALEQGCEPEAAIEGKAQVARVHQAGLKTLSHAKVQLAVRADKHEAWHNLLERAMRQQIQKEKARMESGLGWLASIGSTSPFVGLFGTVWGIMYALEDISAKGSASLEVVAGPIGEALIATACGIAVAVPSVIAYNFFLRQNRRNVAVLDHFVSDFLHATIQDHLIEQTVNDHGNAHSE
jgi:biopolymer transport protein ExbB